jgi:hypothetical protein
MIEIRGAGPPLTEESLTSFERELGTSLPDSYRRFLLRNNGGRPPLEKDTVDVEGLPGSPTDVQDFFGLGDPIESCDLRWNKETLCERIPDSLLAIATDSFGSAFCISLKGADRGAVSFCDLQSVAFNYEADPDFYPVAPDFDSFLNKLREFPDEEPTGADNG